MNSSLPEADALVVAWRSLCSQANWLVRARYFVWLHSVPPDDASAPNWLERKEVGWLKACCCETAARTGAAPAPAFGLRHRRSLRVPDRRTGKAPDFEKGAVEI